MDIEKKPDFIISGAMKSGTTWLHHALNKIPGVYIPSEEIHLFDCFDLEAHPDMQTLGKEGLSLLNGPDTTWNDVHQSLQSSKEMVGYDSTTLFHSNIDLKELAETYPSLKIIVILRNPVDRAFSHYWHLLRTGRVHRDFENELLFGRGEIVARSIYVDKAAKMKSAFKERCHFVCYEEIFAKPEHTLSLLLKFLTIESKHLPLLTGFTSSVSNPGRYPVFELGWRMASWLFSGFKGGRYAINKKNSRGASVGFWAFRFKQTMMLLFAFGVHAKKSKMKHATNSSLMEYFAMSNKGLNEVVGFDILEYWFKSQ